jgi:AraC-like DNA-binding protein
MALTDAAHQPDLPTVRRPHPALARLVDDYVGYDWSAPSPGVHRGLPSTLMTLVFAFDEPLDTGWYDAPHTRRQTWSVLSGLHTRPAEIHHLGRQRGIQVAVTAEGARLLLGLPMRALAADIVSLDDAVGGRVDGWAARLQDQPSWAARYALLDRLLLGLAGEHDRAEGLRPELRAGRRRLEGSGGRVTVSAVAREVGWSRRHFQQQFVAEFGLGPKEYARVVRFGRAKRALLAGWAPSAVAATTGYADQAHLSREWRSMSGYTPREWQRVEVPFLQDLSPGPRHDGDHD